MTEEIPTQPEDLANFMDQIFAQMEQKVTDMAPISTSWAVDRHYELIYGGSFAVKERGETLLKNAVMVVMYID